MKDHIAYLSITTIVMLAIGFRPTAAMFDNICRLFKEGDQIGDPFACNAYIKCINSIEVSTSCPTGQIYSVDTSKCVKSNVTNCDDPCAPDYDNVWASDPKSCNGYFYCNKGVGIFGVCPSDLHFDEDGQQCHYPQAVDCDRENYCHIVPNKLNFKDEIACDKYRVCESGVLKSKSCGTDTLYNRETGSCTPAATQNDCRTIPRSICKNGLLTVKNKFVSDAATCRGYYYCAAKESGADDEPTWGQCRKGLFFDSGDQSCKDPINVKCSFDRCDGREDIFVNSGTNCQNYLVCKNGIKQEERKCADHRFFDEKRQACTSDLIVYKACSG